MAVHLSIQPGYDPSYPWKQIGTSESVTPQPGVDYYLVPAEKGGEPPGRWSGRGLAALGLEPAGIVERQVFEKLFGEHLDPRDPTGMTRLGRAAQQFRPEVAIYRELAAAEPQATPARLSELRSLARAQTRRAVPFWDMTISVSKSVSLFHGSLLAEAEAARGEGRMADAVQWARKAAGIWEELTEAREVGMAYLQDEAGYVRTGYHRGTAAESRAELGKWERAREWVGASFQQHTSRAGDPQMHEHNLILNKARTERDGRWRKLDSKGLYRHRHAAAQIIAAEFERRLTARYGLVWVPRADGHGREIKGVSAEMMDAFSARRKTITALAAQVAAHREAEWGRKPDARQMDRIMRDITQRTRHGKEDKPLDIPALLHNWEDKARAADLASLRDVHRAVMAEAEGARERDQTVTMLARQLAWQIARETGTAPDAATGRQLEAFARWITRRGELAAPDDITALARGFQAQQRADAERQRRIRRATAHGEAQAQAARAGALRGQAQFRAHAVAYPVPGARGLSQAEAQQVMAEAIAGLQAQRTTWTRADLVGSIGQRIPPHAHTDRATLETLAERALAGDAGERVALLSAPEWPRVPEPLRRDDGESMFRPHGAERYASQAQLTLEERLLAQAQATGAPCLDPDTAARLLGASRARLEAQLRPDAVATVAALSEVTGSGLRIDQAAAAYHLLTSPRRAEVMIGPAGTGKTRTAIELARAWTHAGIGPVVALTASSNARNVITAEAARTGVTLAAYNLAKWLGHSESGREALNPVDLAPGTLIILDESSMVPVPDLAAVVRRAAEHGAKVVPTGDPVQLQAVEGGGGMSLLARHGGHVQLSEASRFRQPWEREATLRLRQGDVTVLADYREHDRLHAGNAEDILEDAARAYLHDRLNGKDTLLMAGTEAMAAELSRRVRDDLMHWGLVEDGPSVPIMNGFHASAGDWVMARKNANWVDAGEDGRKLANRDVLRIIDTDPDGTGGRVQVERLAGRDGAGHEQWSAPFKLHRSYLGNHAHLAYAVTFHTAEGRTVDSGISVFTGQEDRQAVNVGMTRGRDNNEAYVIAGWKVADPKPGPEPSPELTRLERQSAERAGRDPGHGPGRVGMIPAGSPQNATAEEVLAKCLDNDRQELSATDTREAEFSDADRLDVLGAQWQHVARDAARRRYQAQARTVLTDAQVAGMAGDPAAEWVWRSLREAEAAGLDSAGVLRRAVASGPLDDAESLAKVIDWRIRQQTAGMPAVAVRPWTEQVPQTGDTDMDRYARELAEAMDDRQRRLGEHAAEHPPAWARSLGPVPDHPVDRAEWEHKAGKVAAYREMWGYTHLHEPIGPRPGQYSPEARASWQAAAEALGRQPGDLSAHSDGQLWAWRSAFAREMAWAPPYKGADLAIVREAVRRAEIEADRARRNAQAADTAEARQRLDYLAQVQAAWEQQTRDLAADLGAVQAGYDAWEAVTAPTRDRALAADAELRRRHPAARVEPLRAPARPAADPAQPHGSAEETEQLSLRDELAQMGWIDPAHAATEVAPAAPEPVQSSAQQEARGSEITARSRADTGPAQPGTRTGPAAPGADRMTRLEQQLQEISARLDATAIRQARQAREKAAEITSLLVPSDDLDAAPYATWVDGVRAAQREAVRHEPMPRVPHAEAIQPAAEAGIGGHEAAD